MSTVDLRCGNVLDIQGNEKYHALLCDPPYHLTSPVSKSGSRPHDELSEQKYNAHNKAGFMGKKWDGGDIAFNPGTWAALAEHLYDGAFGMAFASSRGWHRLACAIEDAGLIIHPTIFGWAFGSGFPKATRIDSQIDKAAGAEQEILASFERGGRSGGIMGREVRITRNVTAPTSPPARVWAGHRYGLQALKPALEPIIVFQKPYRGKPIDCITETGAGALWIDGGRIPAGDGVPRFTHRGEASVNCYGDGKNGSNRTGEMDTATGRWASNFILLDDEAANALDAQSGTLKSGVMRANQKRSAGGGYHGGFPESATLQDTYGDTGGASRFFFRVEEQIDESDPVYYCAKASRRERDAGCGGMEERQVSFMNTHGGNADKGETWHPIDDRTGGSRDRFQAKAHNHHPTVKPIALARYLATLLLPPKEYAPRRILVPFAGVASEMIGAMQAGWEEVVGIEREKEYVEIGHLRLKYYLAQIPMVLA